MIFIFIPFQLLTLQAEKNDRITEIFLKVQLGMKVNPHAGVWFLPVWSVCHSFRQFALQQRKSRAQRWQCKKKGSSGAQSAVDSNRGLVHSRQCRRRWCRLCPSCAHKPRWPHTLLSGWMEKRGHTHTHGYLWCFIPSWKLSISNPTLLKIRTCLKTCSNKVVEKVWDTSPAVPRTTVQQLSSASPLWRPAPSPQTNLHSTIIRHLSACCCLLN